MGKNIKCYVVFAYSVSEQVGRRGCTFLKIPLKQVRDQAQFANILPDALGVWASAGILSQVLLPKNKKELLKKQSQNCKTTNHAGT